MRFLPLQLGCMLILALPLLAAAQHGINRQQLVERHNPSLLTLNPQSALTVGNGQFAVTVDVTGLQSLGTWYYRQGFPLETKARWAWHSRPNPKSFSLKDTAESYPAYGRTVELPTKQDNEAGQWLQQNPHDLPFLRLGLQLDGKSLQPEQLGDIRQQLDMWQGRIRSAYNLAGESVMVSTVVHGERDLVAATIDSSLIKQGRLGISLDFPRGYDPLVKNTPDLDWLHDDQHKTVLVKQTAQSAEFLRTVDDEQHRVLVHWQGTASLVKTSQHHYRLQTMTAIDGLTPNDGTLTVSVEFQPIDAVKDEQIHTFKDVAESAAKAWARYWMSGGVVDFSGSSDPRAEELERRVVLSQYLVGVQTRSDMPAEETGLTSSSWYGKFRTDMAWWQNAHWALWGREEYLDQVLHWYLDHLDTARQLAASRGLLGASWARMVGPDARESPGEKSLLIWNQPQVIHLAELLYQVRPTAETLQHYGPLVEATAQAMSSMLSWQPDKQRYSLLPPIRIAQEIYDPVKSINPGFELAYWRYGMRTAQQWRLRIHRPEYLEWNLQLSQLADLPQRNGKYVALESMPDSFDNKARRKDHPTMLAAYGMLKDETVNVDLMADTLKAVMANWDFKDQGRGWDFPMMAMTAIRLGKPALAIDLLLKDAPDNRYLPNGHSPQPGANLPVYLPANGALLAAVALLASQWTAGTAPTGWQLHAEGMPQ